MSDLSDDLQAFIEATSRPRRRARPRMANALLDAEQVVVEGVSTWRTGPGPAVLLVHGWEDDNSLWDPLIEALARFGRPVVALDLPGHGFSPAEMGSMLEVAARLAAVARACGPIDAVATHSYGGPCAISAIETADFAPERIAIVAAPIVQRDQMVRRAARYEAPPGAVEAIIARFEAANGRSVDWFDMRRAAQGMKAPAMIVHSLDDDVCPVDQVQAVASAWAAGAELVLTDGMGHRDVARDSDVADRIAAFLA